MRELAIGFAVLLLCSCRDEQAGPKKGPQAAQQPQAPQGAPQAAPPPQAMQVLDAVPGELTFTSGGTWADGSVKYLGAKVEPKSPKAGDVVHLSHYFTAVKPPPQGWAFFVHIVDGNSGQMLQNVDHEIQNGAAPLASWPVGKVIEDAQSFRMPSYPGPLQFLIGFWKGDQRLPIDQLPVQDGQQRMRGPILESPQQALPEYRTPKTAKPPTIDGKLDDAAWQAAPAVQLNSSMDGSPANRKTTARVLWDDKFLYVAFDCDDPDVWGTLKNKDDAIYNEEAVEVFLDANGDGKTYNELQVSPHNVQFDAAFVARRSDLETAKKWESGMVTAVNVRGTLDDDQPDQGWSAEMKIPLANLMEVPPLPPKKGDVWRFNLYRLEHHVHREQIEGTSFSPLFVGDFHHLPRFGKLIFD